MKPNPPLLAFALILFTLLLVGCTQTQTGTTQAQTTQPEEPVYEPAGTELADKNPQSPAETNYLEYDSKTNWFKIKYPASWELSEDQENALVSFTSPKENEEDTFMETANVYVLYLGEEPVTLEQFNDDQIKFLAEQIPDMQLVDARQITFGGMPANEMVYLGTVSGNFIQTKQIWGIDSDNYAYVFTYAATTNTFNKYSKTADEMINSFNLYVPEEPQEPQNPENETDGQLTGKWRVYSEAIYYDDGSWNYLDTPASTLLDLKEDGAWSFGSSSGTYTIVEIREEDWTNWGVESYGPTRKLVLDGWNSSSADGPIEETESRIDFMWVIYNAEPPTVENAGQIQMKFGHTIN